MMLNPLHAARRIEDDYRRYLLSTYSPRSPELAGEFESALSADFTLTKGPFLQASAPYETSVPLRALVEEGVLHEGFLDLTDSEFPLDRPLYTHQESAIRKSASGRNLLVATGTGSGKTECFLFPILDQLLRERDAGTLDEPGVRALLLYPMNALANDQVKRLRRLLSVFPDITFGRYVGETEHTPSAAEDAFRNRYPHEPRIENELIARDQMQARPPHILLTNYAMLEYLLLRPADSPMFDGATGGHWKQLVLDEVHVYNGAQGTEIAMLLRRVRDRVLNSERGRLRCFATSATLGRGVHDYPALVEFAGNLLDEPFEWNPDESEAQDVIGPRRKPMVRTEATWALPQELVGRLHGTFRDPEASTADLVGCLTGLIDVIPAPDATKDQFLADVLAREEHVVALQQRVERGAVGLNTAALSVFQGPTAATDLIALVDMCVAARHRDDDAPLIPARYHFFLRALEGAFVCLAPQHPSRVPRVSLNRDKTCRHCRDQGVTATVFELGTCRRCGAEYILGDAGGASGELTQTPAGRLNPGYFLVGEAVPDDDDESAGAKDAAELGNQEGRSLLLCPSCGKFVTEDSCPCGSTAAPRSVVEVKPKSGDVLHTCAACGQRAPGEIVSRTITGSDAPVAVLATSIYQELPASEDPAQAEHVGEGRKLLAFSDSRQDAAFFAPFMERTYERAIRRKLLLDAIRAGDMDEAPRFKDLVAPVHKAAVSALVLDPDESAATNNREVRTWLVAELTAMDRNHSLEGTGLVEIGLVAPRRDAAPPPLLDLGFGAGEIAALLQVLMGTLRASGAVSLPDDVNDGDDLFAPRNNFSGIRESGSEYGVLGWLPGGHASNRRLDYLQRVLAHRGIEIDARGLLGDLWRYLTAPRSAWNKCFKGSSEKRKGALQRLDHERFEFRPATARHLPSRCDTCRKLTWHTVDGVCPSYRCPGRVAAVGDLEALHADHYATLYRTLGATGAVVQEHTAQWTTGKASEIQDEFVHGGVNILSCSTTFELGVDVGEVQAVLLRNVPPSPANYVQRAGRAGRRTDSAALVTTFAQRRNHDLSYFDDPTRMVDGIISPPRIWLDNHPIVRRHIHSVAFAMFERLDSEHRSVEDFFLAPDGEVSACDRFVHWLRSHPDELLTALLRLVPPGPAAAVGLESWTWVDALVDEDDDEPTHGWLGRAADEVIDDIAGTRRLIQEYKAEDNFRLADRMQRVERTLTQRRLLSHLATRNVLPKYGFPVDVVALDVARSGHEDSESLDLDRDLSLAISEYAPGSKVVAAKKLWESKGLRTMSGKAWPQYAWAVCDACGAFRHTLGGAAPSECPTCGSTSIRLGHAGRFVTPVFGFVGARSKEAPGDTRPARLSVTDTYFGSYKPPDPDPEPVPGLPGTASVTRRFSRQGRITVINRGPQGRGFRLCSSCGYGEPAPELKGKQGGKSRAKPKPHRRPTGRGECNGRLGHHHLGHEFLTDVVELQIDCGMDTDVARSVLYALLQSVDSLTISPDDVDGTLHATAGSHVPSLILFDAVPGGAGHVRRIADNLPELAGAALSKVSNCSCGPATSCYQCLRTYRNQYWHEHLSRGAAADVLSAMLGRTGGSGSFESVVGVAHESARTLLVDVMRAGANEPVIGYEVPDPDNQGWTVEAAWTDRRVAVTLTPESDRDAWLVSQGWDVRALSEWTGAELSQAIGVEAAAVIE